jgi:hypothetical protein
VCPVLFFDVLLFVFEMMQQITNVNARSKQQQQQ